KDQNRQAAHGADRVGNGAALRFSYKAAHRMVHGLGHRVLDAHRFPLAARTFQWRRPAIPARKPMPAAMASVSKGRWPISSSIRLIASPLSREASSETLWAPLRMRSA